LLKKFDEKEKENVVKFYNKLRSQKDLPRIISRKDEFKIIEESREFIEKEVGSNLIVTFEERSGLEKKKQAEPFKPAIYFSV
jgi:pantothenate kinase